jgi:hypothetical protein
MKKSLVFTRDFFVLVWKEFIGMRLKKWIVGLSLVVIYGQACAGETLGILGKWRGELKFDIAAVRADVKKNNPEILASYDQKLLQFKNKLKMIWNFELYEGGQATVVAKASGKPVRRELWSYKIFNNNIQLWRGNQGPNKFIFEGKFNKSRSLLTIDFGKVMGSRLDPHYAKLMKARIELKKIKSF